MKITALGQPRQSGIARLKGLLYYALSLAFACSMLAQGTITFDQSIKGSYQTYSEAGFLFEVTRPPPDPPYNYMLLLRAGIGSHPDNGTPHLEFRPDTNFGDVTRLGMINGGTFGLITVDLANTFVPTYTPTTFTFNGTKEDGSLVTCTFTTPGDGAAAFQRFSLSADFASGLTQVVIPSQNWAMDNLVFVPEPGTVGLFALALLAFLCRRKGG